MKMRGHLSLDTIDNLVIPSDSQFPEALEGELFRLTAQVEQYLPGYYLFRSGSWTPCFADQVVQPQPKAFVHGTIGARDILLRLGLRRLAEATVFTNSTGEVCSEMVADVIVTSKLAPDLGTLWSPNSLYKELHERNLVQSMLRIENQPKENEK